MIRTVRMCGTVALTAESPNDICAIVRNTCGDEGWRTREGKKKKERVHSERERFMNSDPWPETFLAKNSVERDGT
jgi:hypothetical protein